MKTIGLELSDAGILAAGDASGDASSLLPLDGLSVESPGYSVQLKKHLLVGCPAEQQARLYPRQVIDQFWSLLSTEPLQEKSRIVQNYAELAYAHLDHIRSSLKRPEAAWVLAVPDYLDPSRLGILLGIARELKIPVRGMVSNAVASVQPVEGRDALLHVDVHLHRTEVALVKQEEGMTLADTQVITDLGWKRLLEVWSKCLANAFVQSTRFDPFHEASAEQALYDKIPGLLAQLPARKPLPLELAAGETVYRIAVPADMLKDACDPLVNRIVERVRKMHAGASVSVQLSHRAARLPGLAEALHGDVLVLDPGAGARGALGMLDQFEATDSGEGAAYLTRRNIYAAAPSAFPAPEPEQENNPVPTHILNGSAAHPIPVVIGSHADLKGGGICLDAGDGVAARHCEVVQNKDGVQLRMLEGAHVRVDGEDIAREISLQAGQRIQVASAVPLLVIHALNPHGT